MAGICCEIVGDSEPSPSRKVRRRRMEVRQLKVVVSDASILSPKRRKLDLEVPSMDSTARTCVNAVESSAVPEMSREESEVDNRSSDPCTSALDGARYGVTCVRGRRREMEDAVSVHASFCGVHETNPLGFDFYGVFDGHGCSHVAMKCKDRMHEIVKEEIETSESDHWKETMDRSFARMDKEVAGTIAGDAVSSCKCDLQAMQCDAVGSTAVVAVVTPDKIVVPNCGDSRAVLCRGGVAVTLSSDHKPDRPDELERIEAAGGRVIYWDGARVLGVLAMSRAIGDNYLKPFVIPDPEVTVTERTDDDQCLILATDGLWDVVSNETACSVARMCLSGKTPSSPPQTPVTVADAVRESSDKACLDASILLTKLALGRNSSDNVSVVVVDLRKR